MRYLNDFNKFSNESIKIPIEVGDTVLGGRFKNKKMVVKKIGKNKKGDITINDKPLLKFRLMKENINDLEDYISDILTEVEDIGLQVEIDRTRKDVEESKIKGYTEVFIEVRIMRPFGSPDRVIPGVAAPPGGKYPGNLFFWYEVKDAIIRLNDWYYSYSGNEYTPGIDGKTARELEKIGIKYNSNSPFRMFTSGTEFGIGCHTPEDFDGMGDFISFSNLRIEMKV